MKKTVKRFAVHKRGTEQLGYLCSFKDEAQALLADLKNNIFSMPQTDLEKYQVVEVEVSWEEDEVN